MKMDYTNAIDEYLKDNKISTWSHDATEGFSSVKYKSVDGFVLPSEAELIEEAKVLQAEYDALEYARNRKAEYDALNQLELISDDTNNGTTTHIDAVNAIKTKYPKPE